MNLIHYRKPERSVWSPFDRMATLQQEMNRLFEGTFGEGPSNLFGGWNPALDVYQDKDNITVTVELPGLNKDEIDISIHEGALIISGERKQESEKQDSETFRSERFFGRFQRSVRLPSAVNADKVTANYKDGVLTVVLPKTEEAKPRQIAVNAS